MSRRRKFEWTPIKPYDGAEIAVVCNKEDWDRAHKSCKREDGWTIPQEHLGVTKGLTRGSKYRLIIGIWGDDPDKAMQLRTAVHECSHAVDFLFEHLGEEKVGTEVRAYLCDWFFGLCLDALGEHMARREAEEAA